MKLGTIAGLGMNASLIFIIMLVTWQHVEDIDLHNRTMAAIEQANLERATYCSKPGRVPSSLRCMFTEFVRHHTPAFIAAVAYRESRFNTTVCSKAGACGLMQFMPGTAQEYRVTVTDPKSSIEGGDRYLADLRRQFGNHGLALAAYNWGPGALSRWLKTPGAKVSAVPAETRAYVLAITGHPLERWLGKTPPPIGGTVTLMAGDF